MQQPNTCETCKHFRQHYVEYGKDYYIPTACGHCVYPRCKMREAYTSACKNYTEK